MDHAEQTLLKKLLFEILSKVQELDIQIAAVITDQGSNFPKLRSQVSITNDKPYILYNDMQNFSPV